MSAICHYPTNISSEQLAVPLLIVPSLTSDNDMIQVSAMRRDVTDEGLVQLTQLSKLQTLVMNNMSSNVTGTFLSSLQGDAFDSSGTVVAVCPSAFCFVFN